MECFQFHLKDDKCLQAEFYVTNCLYLLAHQQFICHVEKDDCEEVVKAYVKCLIKTKKVDDTAQKAILSAVKYWKLEDKVNMMTEIDSHYK